MNILEFFVFILGITIGSFLNVVIYRVPNEKSIVTPRSSCTKCGHLIKWYENIPILSWIFLKGKCLECKASISFIYPFVELLTGIFAYFVFINFYQFNTLSLIQSLLIFLILCAFICHFFIDLKHQILPDGINIFLLVCCLAYSYLFLDFKMSLIGGAFGFALPLFVTWVYYKIRGVIGLGGGDIKLFGILGLLFGLKGVILNLFLSCFVGAAFSLILMMFGKMDREKPIAFGPFIILTSVVQIFKPDLISRVYELIVWS